MKLLNYRASKMLSSDGPVSCGKSQKATAHGARPLACGIKTGSLLSY
jgi:hypothetical protein